MSPNSKKEHLAVVARRHKKSSLREKTIILNEFCANLKFNRKYAIRKIRAYLIPKKNTVPLSNGPHSRYNHPQLLKSLQQIWLQLTIPVLSGLRLSYRAGWNTTNATSDVYQNLFCNYYYPSLLRLLIAS